MSGCQQFRVAGGLPRLGIRHRKVSSSLSEPDKKQLHGSLCCEIAAGRIVWVLDS